MLFVNLIILLCPVVISLLWHHENKMILHQTEEPLGQKNIHIGQTLLPLNADVFYGQPFFANPNPKQQYFQTVEMASFF